MRRPRLLSPSFPAFYHCIARLTNGQALFGPRGPGALEAERFGGRLHRLSAFCGLPGLTHAVMATHVHRLVEVPPPRALSAPELLARVEALHGPARRRAFEPVLRGESAGGALAAQALRERLTARRGDLSTFLQGLKGAFAPGYNRRQGRFGPLWAERFRSPLVPEGRALAAVALYIDLNPVRAGACADPKDYRFCGYAEALGANRAGAGLGAGGGGGGLGGGERGVPAAVVPGRGGG
jgi:putative transposase